MKTGLRAAFATALIAVSAGTAAADHAWVEESNRNAQVILDVVARFGPEGAANLGVEGYDNQVVDLQPRVYERQREAYVGVLAELQKRRAAAAAGPVRQDLGILIDSVVRDEDSAKLHHAAELDYIAVPELVFRSIHSLLDARVAKDRQAKAVERLQRYTGLFAGTRPITELAQDRMAERFAEQGLLGPFRGQVEQDLADAPRYLEGIKELFTASGLDGWQPALAALDTQVAAHLEWVKKEILTRSRDDSRLPLPLYADLLRQTGVDVEPDELIRRALIAFAEIRNEMQALAPRVAQAKGIKATDYRDVIRELKRKQVTGKGILPLYQERLAAIEDVLRKQHIITVPQRKAVIELASEAESAAIPAPHMSPPRLIGNTGEYGKFMLPLKTPGKAGREDLKTDDFTFDAATWTLTAHEARPGHELQFAAMIENGVSTARGVFAFNSVNVEGWALYAEAEMKPYFPLDGQLIGLQHRMMRAARAFLDPMVNLGRIKPEEVKDFLMKEVVLSEGMAQQEVDRYTFRSPGQATSYFFGYQALMNVRQRAQLALRGGFDRQRFHDFVLSQGLLPPKLLEKAVLEDFVPAEQKRLAGG